MNKQIEEIYQQVMDEVCPNPLYRFAELVRQDEREKCAKLCDEHAKESWAQEGGALNCADKIRARGEK
jgi:hypothetical protein